MCTIYIYEAQMFDIINLDLLLLFDDAGGGGGGGHYVTMVADGVVCVI